MRFIIALYSLTFILLVAFNFSCSKQKQVKTPTTTTTITTFSGQKISSTQLDRLLQTTMDSLGMAGLSIAIINDAKVVYHRTMGVSKIKTKKKLVGQHLFDAASMSKTPFTYLTLKLVEQGLLHLDTPLYRYLPYPDIAYDERYKLITARMVLSHTSGFPNWRFFNEDGKLDIKFTPGTDFQYSGEGFEYLAEVLAHLKQVNKNDLQQLFEQEVAKPLGMKHTYYTWNDYVTEHRVSGHFEGKVNPGWGVNKKDLRFRASYSMQTEAVDYAHFMIGLMEGKGLKKESFDEFFKIHVENPDEEEGERVDDRSWALGITVKPTKYGLLYGHSGGNLSFTCEYKFSKEQKTGYVFFTNSEFSTELDQVLMDLFLQ